MQNQNKIIIIFALLFTASTSFAAWDKNCLDTCFSTNHECNYCNFKCTVEEKTPVIYETGDPKCPLANYPNY